MLSRRRWWLGLSLVLSVPTAWIAVSLLLQALMPTEPGGGGFNLFLVMGIFMAPAVFAILLPFLVLSWANKWFRQRLKLLWHVNDSAV